VGRTSPGSSGTRDHHHPTVHYTVTYYKPANSPALLAKNFPTKDNSHVPMTQAEFLERAWKLANDKARELGWIV
jgi:hypothetical protein